MNILDKIDYYLNEGIKIPEIIKLGLKASKYDVSDIDMARAEMIGGMTRLMPEFKKKGVTPVSGFSIRIKGGDIVAILKPSVKKTIKIRMKKNPNYLKDITSILKIAYKKYFEQLNSTFGS